MSSGNGQRRQIQQSVGRRSAASSIRCGSSRSRQLSTRGRCTCASAIHTQPLYSAARALDWYDGIRAIKWRPMRYIGRPRFSSSCSINPGTDGFAGKKYAPRRPRGSGAAVCWLLYINLGRKFTRNAGGLPTAVLSNRYLPEGKFAGASGNRAPQRCPRYSDRHRGSAVTREPRYAALERTHFVGVAGGTSIGQ